LLEVVRGESDPRLRRSAIEALGIIDSSDLGAQLTSLYKTEKDPETREKILESLFTQENARALIEIARAEKDPKLRKKVVELLSNLDSKESTDYMLEILQK
jgi:HEAT repeat protein